jgi:hypothetical protein
LTQFISDTKYKQQRNKVNNLKKQAKKKFYANINENLDELKSANGKLYWKTMNMLIKKLFTLFRCCLYFDSVSTDFTLRKVLRKRSRIRISLLKVESNQTLSSFLIITSLVGMHILAIFKNIDVKSETAP